MLNLSLKELKLTAENRGIKGYESMSLSALIASKPVEKSEKNSDEAKPEINFSKPRIEKIRKKINESRYAFSKIFLIFYDDTEYKGIRDVKDLFDFLIDEDYHKPIITNSAFNNNYIQFKSKGNKDKMLTINENLDMIRPYLSDIINDHKTKGEWRIHSGNTIIKHKTQGEWKIHLTMTINFISSKEDSDETRIMQTKSNNIGIMMGSEADEIIKEFFKSIKKISRRIRRINWSKLIYF